MSSYSAKRLCGENARADARRTRRMPPTGLRGSVDEFCALSISRWKKGGPERPVRVAPARPDYSL